MGMGAKKLRKGCYLYKGYEVVYVGYYHSEQRVVWEAHNIVTGHADAHGYSKRQVMSMIDSFFEEELRNDNNE